MPRHECPGGHFAGGTSMPTTPALTSLTAACADLVQTCCANHGWVLQKASFSSSNKVLFLRIAFSRLPSVILPQYGIFRFIQGV